MLISIVIATWNAEKTIKKCLDSIVPQLSEEVELIVIDGGSTDSTPHIVKSYGNKISYFISERDKGIYDAWNKGIMAACGRWIAFIGADDILIPGAMKEYLKILHSEVDIDSYDYICAHNEFVDMNGKILKIVGDAPKWSLMRKRMPAAHVASLHNKLNLFNEIGMYDLAFKICADYELLLRKKDHLKYFFITSHIARMRVGGMSFSVRAVKETFYIRKKHHSVNFLFNALLFFRDIALFELFILRNKIFGGRFE